MGSITNSLPGVSYLTQPGGLLSNLPSSVSTAALQSATPQDIVNLSAAALQEQEVVGIFGISQASQSAATAIPALSTPAADLTNATAQEKASVNDQALQLQQVQGLFGIPTSLTSTSNVLG
jgi:hypothetical protein